MKVRIIKGHSTIPWYSKQVGAIINVSEYDSYKFKVDGFDWVELDGDNGIYIDKQCCEILPQENQPEPFDLERALKGEKVITGDGDEGVFMFTNPHSYDGDKHLFQFSVKNSGDQYVLVFNGTGWQGGFTGSKHHSPVFMAPRESEYVTKWVNLKNQEVTCNTMHCSHAFHEREQAIRLGTKGKNYIGTFPVTFKNPK